MAKCHVQTHTLFSTCANQSLSLTAQKTKRKYKMIHSKAGNRHHNICFPLNFPLPTEKIEQENPSLLDHPPCIDAIFFHINVTKRTESSKISERESKDQSALNNKPCGFLMFLLFVCLQCSCYCRSVKKKSLARERVYF